MDVIRIANHGAALLAQDDRTEPGDGFLWLDATHEEVAADPQAWRAAVEAATGVQIYDPHLTDAVNLRHPSYFDPTRDYELLVFRKLAMGNGHDGKRASIARIDTRPVAFLLMDKALVMVRAKDSRIINAARTRLLEVHARPGNGHGGRLPASPTELMLRLLNAMVDQYLDLRQPLSLQVDRWQRALLNTERTFTDWSALLDARIELRKLDHLCEEQHDAMQELRDHLVDSMHPGGDARAHDLLMVRINDVMEHIARVLNHARRLEASMESAVQIHYAAMAHRTSEIMRTLTVLTALFMPLTLITGIFGMNFEWMPLLKHHNGFWITMSGMGVLVVVLLLYFRRRRYLEDQDLPGSRGDAGKHKAE
ncbi:magnesium transporter CorA family protein [Noviherbaspirillum pedocola]|uniref:Magnesium transporter CorA family protein n=1 Tax=Noviherbaspirillum pedocola TaxID=2801341 RepID=A0A934W630_9BURK|nr:magnesium transporter CorA family protein [Noviherbaspirillum pedocola]MBK4733873.1 magnesium transporter CorA family protein [Noviherbaspirillum pedocola]